MILRRVFTLLASLKLAVFVLIALSVAMAVGTFLEARTDAATARQMVYAAWWFDWLLGLLSVNVLFAALKRYPWKKRHIGFLATHAAILIILSGTFLTRHFGIEGTLALAEGESASSFPVNEDALVIQHNASESTWEFLSEFHTNRVMRLRWKSPQREERALLQVMERIPHASLVEKVTGDGDQINPAVAVTLDVISHFEHWLFAYDESTNRLDLGEVLVSLDVCSSSEELRQHLESNTEAAQQYPHGIVEITDPTGKRVLLDAYQARDAAPVPLGESGWAAHIAEYLPNAVVSAGQLISRSEQPVNPAVRLIFTSPDGATEERKLFARFPEFSAMHRGESSSFQVEAAYRFDQEAQAIQLLVLPGELLYAVVPNERGVPSLSFVTVGQTIKPLENGIGIRVEAFYPRARREIKWVTSRWEGDPPALRLLLKKGSEQATGWVGYGVEPLQLTIGEETFTAQLAPRDVSLGFELHLIEFGNPTYGGTAMAARYYSEVEIRPSDNEALIEKHTISMNQPLVMNGFRVFQSSYYQDHDGTKISVFSVSRDPGVPLVYFGSFCLILGIALTFYLPRQRTGASNGR